MDEDDDDFFDTVIDFGDGRQYKIAPVEAAPQPAAESSSDAPVRQQDRFADDFDRSWPRSKPPQNAPREVPPKVPRPLSANSTSSQSQSVHSPQEAARVLFNERSNRLEPYATRQGGGGTGPLPPRKNSHSEPGLSPVDSRGDSVAHGPKQLLQKSSDPSVPTSDAGPTRGNRNGHGPPPSSPRPKEAWGRSNSKPMPDLSKSLPDAPGFPAIGSKEESASSTKRSSAGNLPTSPLVTVPDRKEDQVAQPSPSPPTISETPPPASQRRSPQPPLSSILNDRPPLSAISTTVAEAPIPKVGHLVPVQVTAVESPSTPIALQMSPQDLEQARKAAMHSSAERARQRRQQEEEEREKNKERARMKAAELEAKAAAAKATQDAKPSTLSETPSREVPPQGC